MAGRRTDAKLKGLRAPEKGQVEYSDPAVPGLRVRVGTWLAVPRATSSRLETRWLAGRWNTVALCPGAWPAAREKLPRRHRYRLRP